MALSNCATQHPIEYDAAGQVIEVVDARGASTKYLYDELGRQTSVEDALHNFSTTVYDAAGQAIETRDALHALTLHRYDGAGRLYETVAPLNIITSYEYDAGGRQTVLWDAIRRPTRTFYNDNGQPLSVRDARGVTTSFEYDPLGRQVKVQDGRGHPFLTEYNEVGAVRATQDPLGFIARYRHDAAGNLVWSRDAKQQETVYRPDPLNRTGRIEHQDGTSIDYSFDQAGRQIAVSDASGLTSYGYDANDRATSVFYHAQNQGLGYSYDAVGNRLSLTDSSGTTLYTPDDLGRVTQITNPFQETTGFVYDALGREVEQQQANGVRVQHVYDAAGREEVQRHVTATGELLFEQQSLYDAAGNRRQSVEQSLGSGGLQVSIVSYDYDEVDQLVSERKSGADAYSIRYTYDETGNRLSKLEDGWLTIYDYDANNRLMSVPPPLFVPLNSSSSSSGSSSSAGSSSSSSSSSGEASTSSSSSSSSSSSTQYALLLRYWYDDNGNLLRQQQGNEEVLYHWDTHNRLIQVQYADGTSQSFVYSDDGLRKRVVERDGRILDMVWDGTNLLGIVNAATGEFQARFTHAGEGYGGLVSQRSPQGSRFYGFDQSSNTRLLSDPSGDVSDRYSYSAFGSARQVLGGSFNPHRFGGQVGYFQDEQGRSYVQQRYLDTHAGRWMSSDPIGFEGGNWNLYGYVGNNPLNWSDPSGLITLDEIKDFACPKLQQIINSVLRRRGENLLDKRTLPERYNEMLEDKGNLYPYRNDPVPRNPRNPGSTWKGHVDQYETLQDKLRESLNTYTRKKCQDKPGGGSRGGRVVQAFPIPANAWEWAKKKAPDAPLNPRGKQRKERPVTRRSRQPGTLPQPVRPQPVRSTPVTGPVPEPAPAPPGGYRTPPQSNTPSQGGIDLSGAGDYIIWGVYAGAAAVAVYAQSRGIPVPVPAR